ncbi:MAG TPA: hypothetical protein VL240_00910 [Candidatus Binatia bacterium]|nr:hypothetical protein [Candidatus Binatia bacterium]
MGIYPMILFCGALAIERGSSRLISLMLPAAVVVITVLLVQPNGVFQPAYFRLVLHQIMHPVVTCPPETQQFDGACLQPHDAELFSVVSLYLGRHAAPGDTIAVFPYETAFGLTSRHQVAGGVLQSYLVNGDYLTRLELAGLRRARPSVGLYLPDGYISAPLDYVPNFTRSADLWFYLLRHYRAESSPAQGVLGLVRDDGRNERLIATEEQIADPVGPAPIKKRSTAIVLADLRWPVAGADFLKLRLRVAYPAWWQLRKPSELTLFMSFHDGSERWIRLVVPPNRLSDIWVYAWDDKGLENYFAADESQWRPTRNVPPTSLRLLITPYDWISVVPSSVSIQSVQAVRLGMR